MMVIGKRGDGGIGVHRIIIYILLVVVLVLVIYGWMTGGIEPIKNRLTSIYNEILIFFNLKEDSSVQGACFTQPLKDVSGGGELLKSLKISGGEDKISFKVCRDSCYYEDGDRGEAYQLFHGYLYKKGINRDVITKENPTGILWGLEDANLIKDSGVLNRFYHKLYFDDSLRKIADLIADKYRELFDAGLTGEVYSSRPTGAGLFLYSDNDRKPIFIIWREFQWEVIINFESRGYYGTNEAIKILRGAVDEVLDDDVVFAENGIAIINPSLGFSSGNLRLGTTRGISELTGAKFGDNQLDSDTKEKMLVSKINVMTDGLEAEDRRIALSLKDILGEVIRDAVIQNPSLDKWGFNVVFWEDRYIIKFEIGNGDGLVPGIYGLDFKRKKDIVPITYDFDLVRWDGKNWIAGNPEDYKLLPEEFSKRLKNSLIKEFMVRRC